MNKWQKLVRKTHDRGESLTVGNPIYSEYVKKFFSNELRNDLGTCGDVTSRLLLANNFEIEARVFAQEIGVLAGAEELDCFLGSERRLFQWQFKKNDGDTLAAGEEVCFFSGNAQEILAIERLFLNFLQRMSGVASATHHIVRKVENAGFMTFVASTRKTLWGMLDKKAIRTGCGGTHRLGLYDALLVKDTHLKICNYDLGVLERYIGRLDSQKQLDLGFLEVEVESEEMAFKVVEMFGRLKVVMPLVLMFDNMEADTIAGIVEKIHRDEIGFDLLYEASGGIGIGNVLEFAKSGVDVVSTSLMALSSPALSFHLKVA